MADPVAVGKAFTDHYYQTFDTNRSALASLYQDASMLTFEGQQFQGTQAIVEKLTGLPFQSVQHRVVSLDAQPTHAGGLLVFVTGQLLTDGESKPLNHRRHLPQASNNGQGAKGPGEARVSKYARGNQRRASSLMLETSTLR